MGIGEYDLLRIAVKFPFIIEEKSQITKLHPDIQIVELPPKAKYSCFIQFRDVKTLQKVVKDLRKLKIEGRAPKVKLLKAPSSASFKFTITSLTSKEVVDNRLSLLRN